MQTPKHWALSQRNEHGCSCAAAALQLLCRPMRAAAGRWRVHTRDCIPDCCPSHVSSAAVRIQPVQPHHQGWGQRLQRGGDEDGEGDAQDLGGTHRHSCKQAAGSPSQPPPTHSLSLLCSARSPAMRLRLCGPCSLRTMIVSLTNYRPELRRIRPRRWRHQLHAPL